MPFKNMKIAELANGRAAMFGCSAIGLSFIEIKTNIFENALTQDLNSIWWILGIYAS